MKLDPQLLLKRRLVREARRGVLLTIKEPADTEYITYGFRHGYLEAANPQTTGYNFKSLMAGDAYGSIFFTLTNTPAAMDLLKLCVEHDDCLASESLGRACSGQHEP